MTAAGGWSPTALWNAPWRAVWAGAFGLALAMHLAFALSVILVRFGGLLGLFGPVAEPRRKPPETAHQFILMETREDEPVEVAKLEGAASREARDRFQADRPMAAPHSKGSRLLPQQRIGLPRPASPVSPPRPPLPRRRPSSRTGSQSHPALRTRSEASAPPTPQEAAEPLEKTGSPPAQRARPQAPTAPTAQAVAEARRQAFFKPLSSPSAPMGAPPPDTEQASARLEGDRSYRILKARYPEYIAEVQKRFRQGLYAASSVRERSYRTGEVVMRFGIGPDGALTQVELVRRRESMLAEETVCRDALRIAAPFPPLTEQMKKDAELFDNIGLHVFF